MSTAPFSGLPKNNQNDAIAASNPPLAYTNTFLPLQATASPLFTNTMQQETTQANKPTTARHLHLHVNQNQSHHSTTDNGKLDLEPIGWQKYYDQRRMIQLPSIPPAKPTTSTHDEFCVYSAAPTGALATALPPFVIVLLHGGGQSSMAWACVTSLLKPAMHILAFDLRGHGGTHTNKDADLSMPRLVDDTIHVIKSIYPHTPPLLLVGHSLGGAIAVHVTARKKLPVCGLMVVDLVEGSAVSSLDHMSSILSSRPTSFARPEDAVQWSLYAGAMRNVESARVSVPDQLVKVENDQLTPLATSDSSVTAASSSSSTAVPSPASPSLPWRWRTDLLASAPYWSDWFCGLSNLFLSCSIPKVLLLAGSDRLDTPMMIAHMQGKLQLEVLGNSGHSIQEDQPRETARKIAEFVARHKMHSMAAAWAKQTGPGVPASIAAQPASNSAASAPAAVAGSIQAKPPVPLFKE